MGALSHQLMVKNESTYGTAVTPDRTFEYNSESIVEQYGRTEGDPLRKDQFYARSDRHTPYFAGASGSIELDVMTKGFGWWLKQALGAVGTAGPAETTVYTHSGSTADLLGTSFTAQIARPFHPTGTAQAFTYEGGKVTEWEFANSVDGNLVFTAGCDFQQVATGTALATASYPTGMENLTWAGGVVTLGGTQVALDEISIKGSTGLNVERRKIDGSTDKKEPTGGRKEASFSLGMDFESLAQRTYAAASTAAGNMAQIVATWTGPTLLGTTIYPSLVITLQARLDEFSANADAPEGISQAISGALRHNSSDITIVYKSADTTA